MEDFWSFLRKFDNIKDIKTNKFYEEVYKELIKDEYTEVVIKNIREEYFKRASYIENLTKDKYKYIFEEREGGDKKYRIKLASIKSKPLEFWVLEQGEYLYNRIKDEGILAIKEYVSKNNITMDDIIEERIIYDVFCPAIEKKRSIKRDEIVSMMDELDTDDFEKIKDYVEYLEYKKSLVK